MNCDNCFEPATKSCLECNNKFCTHCANHVHNKLPHITHDIALTVYCDAHPKEKATFVCFTCKILVCKDCVNLQAHGDHITHTSIHEKEAIKDSLVIDKDRIMKNYIDHIKATKSIIEKRIEELIILKKSLVILDQEISNFEEERVDDMDMEKIAHVSQAILLDHVKQGLLTHEGTVRLEIEETSNEPPVDGDDFESQEMLGVKLSSHLQPVSQDKRKSINNIFKMKTKQEIHSIDAHKDSIWGLAISKRSSSFASCSEDKSIKIWSQDIKKLEAEFVAPVGVNSVVYSWTGDRILGGLKNGVIQIEQVNGKSKQSLLKGHTKCINSLDCNKNDYLVSGSDDCSVRLWDIAKGKQIWSTQAHQDDISSVSISDSQVLSGGMDNLVKFHDIKSGKLTSTLSNSDSVTVVKFIDEKSFAVAFQKGKISIFDQRDLSKPVKQLSGHDTHVTCLSLHNFNSSLISGGFDARLKLWNMAKGECVDTMEGHIGYVRAVISAGDTFISCGEDKTIKFWKSLQ